MKITSKLAVATAALVCSGGPGLALAAGHEHGKGNGNAVGHQPTVVTPNSSPPAQAHAYGRFCQGQSKTHVAGTPGTQFSKCVTAMAKLAANDTHNPTKACKTLSKKHVAGTPGTPYSRCVSSAAKLLKDLHPST